MPGGRPTDYRAEFCQMLVEHQADGGSYQGFGAVVNVSIQTLYVWEKKHPEFVDAKKRAKTHNRRFMDNIGKQLMTGALKGNPVIWIMIMKNAHGYQSEPPPDEDDAISGMTFED